MSIAGKWRITDMDGGDQDAFDLLGPAFFSFDGKRSGRFRFIHQGDDSGFKAIRAEDDSKAVRTRARGGRKATRGLR